MSTVPAVEPAAMTSCGIGAVECDHGRLDDAALTAAAANAYARSSS